MSENPKHTPGPWDTSTGHDGGILVVNRSGEIEDDVALVYGGNSGDRERACADARLIVAAPDLLDALRAIVSTYRTFRGVPKSEQEWTPLDDEALEAGFKAIAKAEGAS